MHHAPKGTCGERNLVGNPRPAHSHTHAPYASRHSRLRRKKILYWWDAIRNNQRNKHTSPRKRVPSTAWTPPPSVDSLPKISTYPKFFNPFRILRHIPNYSTRPKIFDLVRILGLPLLVFVRELGQLLLRDLPQNRQHRRRCHTPRHDQGGGKRDTPSSHGLPNHPCAHKH